MLYDSWLQQSAFHSQGGGLPISILLDKRKYHSFVHRVLSSGLTLLQLTLVVEFWLDCLPASGASLPLSNWVWESVLTGLLSSNFGSSPKARLLFHYGSAHEKGRPGRTGEIIPASMGTQ